MNSVPGSSAQCTARELFVQHSITMPELGLVGPNAFANRINDDILITGNVTDCLE